MQADWLYGLLGGFLIGFEGVIVFFKRTHNIRRRECRIIVKNKVQTAQERKSFVLIWFYLCTANTSQPLHTKRY